jgi:hypothetical protein
MAKSKFTTERQPASMPTSDFLRARNGHLSILPQNVLHAGRECGTSEFPKTRPQPARRVATMGTFG